MTNSRAPADRQRQVRNIVIEHDRFNELVGALSAFHRPVVGGLHSVGCLSAIVGDSRTGKSFGTKRYARGFPAAVGEAGMIMPVVYADMPMEGGGGPRAILENLASALELSITLRMTNPMIIASIHKAIVDRQVEHLLLDEWDQVFRENDRRLTGFGRGLLRKILNLQTVSITCIGLLATYEMLHADEQLRGRGGLAHLTLRPYGWKSEQERQAFRLLCDAFDRQLPFNEQAGLGRTSFAERLHWVSDGNIGRLKVIIEAAAALAINDESDRVDLRHFADAYEVRKTPGTAFNPFAHDMSKAPKPAASRPGPGRLKSGSISQLLSKQPSRDVTEGLDDVA
jgi:hypothetical protein